MQFIDVFEDGLDGYDRIKQFMDRGFSLPLISIGDKKFFYGGISNKLIYSAAKEFI